MKQHKKIYKNLMAIAAVAAMATGCTDKIQFGDSFLVKPSSSTVTKDTVFNKAEYTKQFLTSIYALQYYGLPYNTSCGNAASPYTGKLDGFTDCYNSTWSATALATRYYNGTMTANETPLMSYSNDNVWQAVHACWNMLENVDRVPDLSESAKAQYKAETKCLLVDRYFDLFQNYGGLPLIKNTFTGTDASYQLPRASVDSTVNFMVELLDEAINSKAMPWAYNGNTTETDAKNNTGRWTTAAAMALKAKILTFAASPLFNSATPYYDGTTEAEQQHLVWYGNYDGARWQRALKACEDFFTALKSNGYYQLVQSEGTDAEHYRLAYRKGYAEQGSPEILHSVRVQTIDAFKSATYLWHYWADPASVNRLDYSPTEEYVEMFPWSSGLPFDWDKDSLAGKINGKDGKLFFQYKTLRGGKSQKIASRDPRLYEECIVNGQQKNLDWTTAKNSGNLYELWVSGQDANKAVYIYNDGTGELTVNQTGGYSTGYFFNKYFMGSDYMRKYTQWVSLGLNDMYLVYAECLAQTGNLTEALKYVDKIRARVGMMGLADCNPRLNLTSNKDNLIEEILRERACELGMSNSRYYDMVRYKRTDWLTKPLHGIATFRLQENASGQWIRAYRPYEGEDKTGGMPEPTRFEYQRIPIKRQRAQWSLSANSLEAKKWLLSPMPQVEINKGYGMVQNPGW